MKLTRTLPALSLAFALTVPLALLARPDALPSAPTPSQTRSSGAKIQRFRAPRVTRRSVP